MKTQKYWSGILAVILGTFLGVGNLALAEEMDMGDVNPMPVLKEKEVYTVTGKENWADQTGFGAQKDQNEMMNQMMVAGSGMEGMKMQVADASNASEVKMADSSASAETKGMDEKSGMKPKKGKKSKVSKVSNKEFYSVQPSTKPDTAKVGKNAFDFTVKDSKGMPVKGLKIKASVFMTSMDMGTTNPSVQDKGKGLYSLSPEFSMTGPWRLKMDIALPDGKTETHNVDFDVQMAE